VLTALGGRVLIRLEIGRETRLLPPDRWYTAVVTNLRRAYTESLFRGLFCASEAKGEGKPFSPPPHRDDAESLQNKALPEPPENDGGALGVAPRRPTLPSLGRWRESNPWVLQRRVTKAILPRRCNIGRRVRNFTPDVSGMRISAPRYGFLHHRAAWAALPLAADGSMLRP
jgi:hypothetical protein